MVSQNPQSNPTLASIIELGINHEQQHQELLLTDILALFALSPLKPAYRESEHQTKQQKSDKFEWLNFEGGVNNIGYDGDGFHYDNEGPRHKTLLQPFSLSNRLVTNAEWLEFIDDGAYEKATLWLSDGWAEVNNQGWQAPGYWGRKGRHLASVDITGPIADRPHCTSLSRELFRSRRLCTMGWPPFA